MVARRRPTVKQTAVGDGPAIRAYGCFRHGSRGSHVFRFRVNVTAINAACYGKKSLWLKDTVLSKVEMMLDHCKEE